MRTLIAISLDIIRAVITLFTSRREERRSTEVIVRSLDHARWIRSRSARTWRTGYFNSILAREPWPRITVRNDRYEIVDSNVWLLTPPPPPPFLHRSAELSASSAPSSDRWCCERRSETAIDEIRRWEATNNGKFKRVNSRDLLIRITK